MTMKNNQRASMTRRTLLAASLAAIPSLAFANSATKFRRIRTQYIAALGDPSSRSGTGAQHWGVWRKDPGPRGVWLQRFDDLQAAGGRAPAQWMFDDNEWWLDENGLLMEKPIFSVPPGKYVVTGDRDPVGILTIHPENFSGDKRWELDDAVTLHDVTHLPCRTARYIPTSAAGTCSPKQVDTSAFPVTPGGPMPEVSGCQKLDYSVLFVIGVEATT